MCSPKKNIKKKNEKCTLSLKQTVIKTVVETKTKTRQKFEYGTTYISANCEQMECFYFFSC